MYTENQLNQFPSHLTCFLAELENKLIPVEAWADRLLRLA